MALGRLWEKRGLYPVAVLLAVCFLVARNWGALNHPAAMVEDGKYILGYFYENPDIASVWRYYASYVSVGPNLVGWVVAGLPLIAQPFFLVAVPLVLFAAVAALPAWNQIVIPGLETPVSRLSLVAVFLLAPIANGALVQMSMYSLWSMLMFVSFLALFWRPSGRVTTVAITILALLAIFSHPIVICLLPILAWRIWTEWRSGSAWVFSLFAVGICSYLLVAVERGGGGTGSGGFEMLGFARLLLERVVFEAVFGTFVRMNLIWNDLAWVMWIVSGLILLGLAVAAVSCGSRPMLWASVPVVYLLLAYAAVGYVSRGGFLDLSYAHRYTFPSKILLIILGFMLLAPVAKALLARGRIATGLVFGMAVVWVLASVGLQQRYYRHSPDEAARLSAFLGEVSDLEHSAKEFCRVLDRGEWSIRMSRPPSSECRLPAE